mgnify:CR=1 FL=1
MTNCPLLGRAAGAVALAAVALLVFALAALLVGLAWPCDCAVRQSADIVRTEHSIDFRFILTCWQRHKCTGALVPVQLLYLVETYANKSILCLRYNSLAN